MGYVCEMIRQALRRFEVKEGATDEPLPDSGVDGRARRVRRPAQAGWGQPAEPMLCPNPCRLRVHRVPAMLPEPCRVCGRAFRRRHVTSASGWRREKLEDGKSTVMFVNECGGGRYDTAKRYGKPTKDVWLCPLAKHWRRTLRR